MARFVSKTAFLELLGDTNFRAVLAASKQSIDIEAWVFRFQATSEVPGIDLDYVSDDGSTSTRGGIELLEAAGIFDAGTVARMYPPTSAPARVRVKAPFNEAFPDEYDAAREGEVWTLTESGAQFAPEYVKEV